MSQFDAYGQWLNVPPERLGPDGRPKTHYDLLGLEPQEAGLERIRQAAEQRYARIRSYASSPQQGVQDLVARIRSEIVEAEICLTDAEKKRSYDRLYRLPTEAEWEYACRAGDAPPSVGNVTASQLARYAWFGGSTNTKPHPVGQKLPNALGLYDMHGTYGKCARTGTEKTTTEIPLPMIRKVRTRGSSRSFAEEHGTASSVIRGPGSRRGIAAGLGRKGPGIMLAFGWRATCQADVLRDRRPLPKIPLQSTPQTIEGDRGGRCWWAGIRVE